MLFLMLGKSVSLEGSQEGIQTYLASDFSVLVKNPEVWPKAVSQIFFSIGITFGIMTAYGSHCKRDEPAFMNSCVIAFSNSLFSFIAGFAVFAALGHLAVLEDVEDIKDLPFAGFGLVFGSWPVVLGTLPGGEHWIRLLFFMLFCLGIDSAFSFMEGFLICANDTIFFGSINPKYTVMVLTVVAWLFSLIYATDAGLVFLDTIDYYINFVMLLVGGFKCFAAGWLYNIEEQIDSCGAQLVFTYMTASFGPVFLACIVWFSVADAQVALWAGFVGLIIFYFVGLSYTAFLIHKKMKNNVGFWSWKSTIYDLSLRNVTDLRTDLSGVVGYLPYVWGLLIKYFCPHIIIVLFSLGCSAKTETGQTQFGHYGGYVFFPFQLLGILTIVFAGFLFLSSLVFPRMYNWCKKADSPIVSKNATIHMAPQDKGDDGNAAFSMTQPTLWPPKKVDASANNRVHDQWVQEEEWVEGEESKA